MTCDYSTHHINRAILRARCPQSIGLTNKISVLLAQGYISRAAEVARECHQVCNLDDLIGPFRRQSFIRRAS